jgi:hypothetical protein
VLELPTGFRRSRSVLEDGGDKPIAVRDDEGVMYCAEPASSAENREVARLSHASAGEEDCVGGESFAPLRFFVVCSSCTRLGRQHIKLLQQKRKLFIRP